MSGLAEAGNHLADLLERENQALQRLDFKTATALLDAKRAGVAALERAGRDKLRAPDDEPVLRAAEARLLAASGANKTLLERAMNAQRHVMAVLARAARSEVAPTQYGGRGVYVTARAGQPFALSARA